MVNVQIVIAGSNEVIASGSVDQHDIDVFIVPVLAAVRAQGVEVALRQSSNGDLRLKVKGEGVTPELVMDSLDAAGVPTGIFRAGLFA